MKSQTKNLEHRLLWHAFVVLLSGMLFAGVALADGSDEVRSSFTAQGKGIERGSTAGGVTGYDEFEPLTLDGKRVAPGRQVTASKAGRPTTAAKSVNTDFWIYGVDVELFSDQDRDGYYHGIDLLFDADTVYMEADVYAVIYLSYEGGPWNEYTTTKSFAIFGASNSDEYTVETELVSGYPTGDYDLLIELFDAFDDSFVASMGPGDSSELSFLPLEDAGRDALPDTLIVVSGGGSLGWLSLLFLAGFAAMRRRS